MESLIFRRLTRSNDLEEVRKILNDPDTDLSDYDHYVMLACEYGNLQMAELLLEHPKSESFKLYTESFMKSCRLGHYKIVELLLDRFNIDVFILDNKSIKLAIERCHYKTVKVLINHPKIDISEYNNSVISHINRFYSKKIADLLLTTLFPYTKNIMFYPLVRWFMMEKLFLLSQINNGLYIPKEIYLNIFRFEFRFD